MAPLFLIAALLLQSCCSLRFNTRLALSSPATATAHLLVRRSGSESSSDSSSDSDSSDSDSSDSSCSDSSDSDSSRKGCWRQFYRWVSKYSYLQVPSSRRCTYYMRTEKECQRTCERVTHFRCSRYNFYYSRRSARYNKCMLLDISEWDTSYLRIGYSVKYWKYVRNNCRIKCDHSCPQPCVNEIQVPSGRSSVRGRGTYSNKTPMGSEYICPEPKCNVSLCTCNNTCDLTEICNPVNGRCEKTCSESVGFDFTLMFMENRNLNAEATQPQLEVYVAAANAETLAKVRVYTPNGEKTGCIFDSGEREVRSNLAERFEVPPCLLTIGTGRSLNVVKVEEISGPVRNALVVYGVNKLSFTADAFLAIPDIAIGKEYVTLSFANPHFATQFAVVSVEKDTVVSVTLSSDKATVIFEGVTHLARETFNFTMSVSEAVQFQSTTGDLTGSRILCSKGCHVYSGNIRSSVPAVTDSRDHLVEELLPVKVWSTTYVAIRLPNRTADFFRFVAGDKPTNITVYGFDEKSRTPSNLPLVQPYGSVQVQTNRLSRPSVLIRADYPIAAAQFTRSEDIGEDVHDPSLWQLIPSELFTNNFMLNTPEYTGGLVGGGSRPYQLNLALIVATGGGRMGIIVDTQQLNFLANWTKVPQPSTDKLQYFTSVQSVHPGNTLIYHPDSNYKFMVYAYGADNRESYGFPVKANISPCPPDQAISTVPGSALGKKLSG